MRKEISHYDSFELIEGCWYVYEENSNDRCDSIVAGPFDSLAEAEANPLPDEIVPSQFGIFQFRTSKPNLDLLSETVQRSQMLDMMASTFDNHCDAGRPRRETRVLRYNAPAEISLCDIHVDARVLNISPSGMLLLTAEDLDLKIGDVIDVECSGEQFQLTVTWISHEHTATIIGGKRTSPARS